MQQPQGKILLVEDDPQLADALTTKFQRSSFELVHAATGQEGLRLLRTEQPDLMILDLMLPDVSGHHLLQVVRDEGTLPVVIISAKCEERDRIRGLERGADDYLTKPLSPKELVARVNAVLRRAGSEPGNGDGNGNGDGQSPAAAEPVVRGGGIELNLQTQQASLDGQPLDLTPTEFRLLKVFVERAGCVLGIDRLVHSVWGYDGYDRHIVVSHIHRLRAKIEDDPSRPRRLVTLRGFGYKLRDTAAQ